MSFSSVKHLVLFDRRMNLKDSTLLLSFLTHLWANYFEIFLPNLYRHWILATIEKSAKQTHFKYVSGVKNIVNLSLVLILRNHKDGKNWVIWMFNLKQHKHEISGNKQNNSSNNIYSKQQEDNDPLPNKETNNKNKTTKQQKQKPNPKLHDFGKDQFSWIFLSEIFYHKLH